MILRLHHLAMSVALILWGVVPIWFYQTDRLRYYLTPDFEDFALAGGIGLLILGVFNIIYSGDVEKDCCHDHGSQVSLQSIALMVAPILLATLWTKDHYSLETLRRKEMDSPADYFQDLPPFTLETLRESTSQTDDGHYNIPLIQMAMASGDQEVREVFDGLEIVTSGRLIADREGNYELFEIFMTCCAADAQTLRVPLRKLPTELPSVSAKQWVDIKGTLHYRREGEGFRPVVDALEITVLPDPERGGFSEYLNGM